MFSSMPVFQRKEWADCGKASVVGSRGEQEYAVLTEEDHLVVIAAGGPAGGFGAVIHPPCLEPKAKPSLRPSEYVLIVDRNERIHT